MVDVALSQDGDPLGQFSVTAADDEWRLISRSPLDREDKDKYTLRIMATDGRFQTSANVEIHVLDVNDNSPLCEQVSVMHWKCIGPKKIFVLFDGNVGLENAAFEKKLLCILTLPFLLVTLY